MVWVARTALSLPEQHDQEENPQTVSPANSMSNAWLSDRPNSHTHTHRHTQRGTQHTHASTFTQECEKPD